MSFTDSRDSRGFRAAFAMVLIAPRGAHRPPRLASAEVKALQKRQKYSVHE
jgi:hypothetical protein